MEWVAGYVGERFFDSRDVAWADLPGNLMLAVRPVLSPPYVHVIKGGDWYWIDAQGRIRRTRTHPRWGCWSPPPRGVPREMRKRSGSLPDEEWEPWLASFMAMAV